jgi:hypothetical protein
VAKRELLEPAQAFRDRVESLPHRVARRQLFERRANDVFGAAHLILGGTAIDLGKVIRSDTETNGTAARFHRLNVKRRSVNSFGVEIASA